jgi:DNA helicase II / ATP-dependent DNA helicase PcrA
MRKWEAPVEADGPDAVLAALDPEQREVALAPRGPVCVLAGAGTGKTRAVAHRIAYLAATGAVDPARVLAVTFTTRAAGELRARLRHLAMTVPAAGLERVQARTFHSAALRQLTYFWPMAVGGPVPQVIDSKISILAEAARRLRLKAGLPELRDAAAEVEWAKVTQVRADDYPEASAKAGRTPPFPPAVLARLYAAYEELRRERHVVDFESVLELTAAILVDNEAAATAVRDQYESFVVDEFQDVNPLQKLLLEAWLGDREDVCVVGDPRQTIYSFTGATPGYLTGFPAEFPDAAVIRLVRNYRSTPQIVDLANRISHPSRPAARAAGLGRPASGGAGSGGAPLDGATLGGAPLVAQQAAGPEPQFTEYPDEAAEAAGVARQIAALVSAGQPASRIAVLVRINAQTQAFEQALADAGVPFLLRGTERFFERPEVRQAVALLRGAARSVSAEDVPAAQIRPVLAGIGLSPEPPVGRGTARERWESLEAVAELAADYFAATPQASLADLAGELALRSAIGQAPAMEGVTLGSLHSAKGLEWDVVFLAGLTEGTLPIIYAQADEAIAEERRLFYVGVTRARGRLYLSWALARAPGGRRTRKPSRFLDGIRSRPRARGLTPGGWAAEVSGRAATAGASRYGAGGADSSSGAGGAGRAGGSGDAVGTSGADGGSGADAAGDRLFEALRDWRAATARQQGVPSYVVFSDATLLLIVGRRPASRAELATVPGVGAVKLDRYGAAVLGLCAEPGAGSGGGAHG